MRKRILSLLLCVVMMLSLLPAVAFAADETLAELRIYGDTTSVTAGVLPGFTTSTTTENVRIEQGGNSCWLHKLSSDESWQGWGDGTPSATSGDGSTYALRLCVLTEEGYAITEETNVYYNDQPVSNAVGMTWSDGAYVYIDLGQATGENPSMYTVTFNSMGGTEVNSQTLASGAKVGKPSAPTRAGYQFKSWYVSEDCEQEFDFNNTIVSSDMTIYAGWEQLTVLTELHITGSTTSVTAGVLPDFTTSTTTEHVTIEQGGNSRWMYKPNSDAPWQGWGDGTPSATSGDGSTYALRLLVRTEEGYAITGDTNVYYNGQPVSDAVGMILSNGAYVYIDLGTVGTTPDPEPEPTNYPVWVSSVRVSSANASDVLGDGNVSYDPDTKTLTVKDSSGITTPYQYSSITATALIYADLSNTETLTVIAPTGEDGLKLNGGTYCVLVDGGGLKIEGNAATSSDNTDIFARKNIEITGDLNSDTKREAVHSSGGTTTIHGNATVSCAEGDSTEYAIYGLKGVEIGKVVKITGNPKYGVCAYTEQDADIKIGAELNDGEAATATHEINAKDHAIQAAMGSTSIKGNLKAVTTSGSAVEANKLLEMAGGAYTWELTGTDNYWNAAFAAGSVTIHENCRVVDPAGGEIKQLSDYGNKYYPVDSTGAKVGYVKIAPNAVESYPVWVSGVQIDEDNKGDVLGDGKVSYDPATKTLTVNSGASITGVYHNSLIYASNDLTINAEDGLILSNSSANYGINCGGLVTLNGKDTATHVIETKNAVYSSSGFVVNGSLTATVAEYGLSSGGNITISKDVNITAGNTAIGNNGSVTIGGNAAIASEEGYGINAPGDVVLGSDDTGVHTHTINAKNAIYGGNITVKGSLKATAVEEGLSSSGDVAVTKDADITAVKNAIANNGSVTIGGNAKLTSSTGHGINCGFDVTLGSADTASHEIKAAKIAIYGSSITVTGSLTATAGETGLSSSGDVTVTKDADITAVKNAIANNGKVTIGGNAAITSTADTGISSQSDVTIKGTANITSTGAGKYGISAGGDVVIGSSDSASHTIKAGGTAIFGRSITINGSIEAETTQGNAIFSQNGVTITKDATITAAKTGIASFGDTTIKGTVNITSNGTGVEGYGIQANDGGIVVIGSDDSASHTIKAGNTAIFGGSITINGSIEAETTEGNAIVSQSGVTITKDAAITAAKTGITSSGDATIKGTVNITSNGTGDEGYGIQANDGGNVVIGSNDSASHTIKAGKTAIFGADITVNGSIEAETTEGNTLFSSGDITITKDADIKGAVYGISAGGEVKVGSGTWTIDGASVAILAQTITIPADHSIKEPADGTVSSKTIDGNSHKTVTSADGTIQTHVVIALKPTYTISYDLNGGTMDGNTGIVTVDIEEGTVITLPAPTKAGFDFDYWEGSRYNAGDSYLVTEDHTFTAQWKEVEEEDPTDPSDPTDPNKPEKPEKPGKNDKSDKSKDTSGSETASAQAAAAAASGAVPTGDSSHPALWFCLMAASLAGAAALFRFKRKLQ